MKKRILVSVDHMYGMGSTAITLITSLKARLVNKRYLMFEHATPDVPRAILQAPIMLAEKPNFGDSFWFDFGTELLTKAKVCEEIMSQFRITLNKNDGMVIFCKNMNGTTIHGVLRNPNWHKDGMDKLESRMRCGVSLGEQVSPDLNILLDDSSENILPLYEKSVRDVLDQINDVAAKQEMRIFFDEIVAAVDKKIFLCIIGRVRN